MIEKKVKLYEFNELSEEAKERALKEWQHEGCHGLSQIYFDEVWDSYKAFIEHTGFTLKDYSLDTYTQNITLYHDYQDEIYSMTGKRALAWLENNLLYKFRVTYTERYKNLKKYRKYGKNYKVGNIKDCQLTGLFSDDDFILSFVNNIKNGVDIEEAFYQTERKLAHLLRSQEEWLNSEEYLNEHCIGNEIYFLENGEIAPF